MPRIEIVPTGWAESAEANRGDGTPTVDVCAKCAPRFVESQLAPPECSWAAYPSATVGSTAVAHPPYQDTAIVAGDYQCAICGVELGEADD